ncbi:hypothetical protein ADIARSV_4250 [Arcticibacter svalbardensis MN12-7]|uniref:Uncharacterized protein n=1 Tax=Arcticibacter svalbardensis MN12-7 TaxID=1150600 RepID=R9GLZ6_9SPHI|nr:hypothetical protein ADIARSV_4250 [Arcticibacter svalbardensis MN12-7]
MLGAGVNDNIELSNYGIMARTKINAHFDANILLNLTDFSKNRKNFI